MSGSEALLLMRGFRRLGGELEKSFLEENSGKFHPLGGKKKGPS